MTRTPSSSFSKVTEATSSSTVYAEGVKTARAAP